MCAWKCSIGLAILFLTGCQHNSTSQTALIEQPTIARPIVAVVPVMDRSRHELSWNLSHELTQSLKARLSQHGSLYLLSDDQVYALTRKSINGNDPFGTETAWVKKGYSQNEFAVFFELLDHREQPLSLEESDASPAELSLTMRVRVFDLRGETPQIILEERVDQTHHIPKQFTRSQFNQVPWGDEMFDISPLGIAHEKLCQELASRVEDYILLNCR